MSMQFLLWDAAIFSLENMENIHLKVTYNRIKMWY
jgi:hypothetical protein